MMQKLFVNLGIENFEKKLTFIDVLTSITESKISFLNRWQMVILYKVYKQAQQITMHRWYLRYQTLTIIYIDRLTHLCRPVRSTGGERRSLSDSKCWTHQSA